MEYSRFNYLVQQYLAKEASAEELAEFYEVVRTDGDDIDIKKILAEHWLDFTTKEEMPLRQADDLFNSVIHQTKGLHYQSAKVVSLKNWRLIAAAAIIIIMLGPVALYFSKNVPKTEVAENKPAVIKDVAPPPKSTKALVQLANGKIVSLDNITSGVLAEEGKVDVIKTKDGRILYKGVSTETTYNTLINPRGSNIVSLVLNDGTKVWLNNESSLRYPTAFNGAERAVEITGEAYFEVAKDPSRKFTVKGNGVVTEVLGTHFNITSYTNEADTKVTLLEGVVKVTKGSSTGLLKPGQQAAFRNVIEKLTITSDVDVDKTIAWMTDAFSFDDDDLPSVMRQLSRWYDIDVNFTGKIPTDLYSGMISRQLSLRSVLQILKVAGIKYSITNKKMTIESFN